MKKVEFDQRLIVYLGKWFPALEELHLKVENKCFEFTLEPILLMLKNQKRLVEQ